MTIAVIERLADFEELAGPWQQLVAESAASVFQSFEWLRQSWVCYHSADPAAQLFVVTVHAGERLVAAGPFVLQRLRALGCLRLARLVFLGHGHSDYQDLLIAPGFEEPCTRAIAGLLHGREPRIDVLLLAEMPDRSATHARLYELLGRLGYRGENTVSSVVPRTPLGPSWDATVAALPSGPRQRLRRRQRKIMAAFATELEVISREADLPAAMDDLVRLHQARWTRRGKRGMFGTDPHSERFNRSVAPALLREGRLVLSFLRLNGERVACSYALRSGDEIAYYQGGLAESDELSRFAVGLVLHDQCMAAAVQQGIRIYDFLRGQERYKYELGAVDSFNRRILLIDSRRPSAAPLYRVFARTAPLLARIRRRLRARWRGAIGDLAL